MCRVLVLAGVLLSFALVGAEPAPAGEHKAFSIPVVTTYEELLEQPALDIRYYKSGERDKAPPTHATVRLGLEASEFPVGAGVLIYALTDGVEDHRFEEYGAAVGPLPTVVQLEGSPPPETPKPTDWKQPSICHGRLLFCRSIVAKKQGKYVVRVLDPVDGSEIANAPFTVTANVKHGAEEAPFHAWSLIFQGRRGKYWPDGGELVTKDDGYREDISGPRAAHYKYCGPAVPSCGGLKAAVFDGEIDDTIHHGPPKRNRHHPAELLSRLLPDEPQLQRPFSERHKLQIDALIAQLGSDEFDVRETADAALRTLPEATDQLKRAMESLHDDAEMYTRADRIQKSFTSIPPFQIRWINDLLELSLPKPDNVDGNHFTDSLLVRWWVNGKPHLPEKPHCMPLDGRGGLCAHTPKALKLDVLPSDLGAKAGDRIQIQLLYCPGGWSADYSRGLGGASWANENRFPLASNVVEVTLAEPKTENDELRWENAAGQQPAD